MNRLGRMMFKKQREVNESVVYINII